MSASEVQVDREKLAWAAGFFDGEGSFVLQSDRYPVLSINQAGNVGDADCPACCPEVLFRFQEAILPCVSRIYGPNLNHSALTRLPMWTLRIGAFEQVQATVARLWPWLGEVKREQAHRVLSGRKSIYGGTHCFSGHDLAILGRDNQGRCRQCRREKKQ